jgi:hypothetical protein
MVAPARLTGVSSLADAERLGGAPAADTERT